jgi:predicted nucleotidyltransferase
MVLDAQTVARLVRPVLERHGIVKAILFGSIATGRDGPRSDVDLILISGTEKRFFDRYDGLLQDLYVAIPGRDIDVLVYTAEELEGIEHRPFIRRALAEGRVIYERGEAAA